MGMRGIRRIQSVLLVFVLFHGTAFAKSFCLSDLAGLVNHAHSRFLDVDPENIRIAAIVIPMRAEKFLMGLRIGKNGNEVGTWGFPGGKMEDIDTTIYEAARREFFEETGLDISVNRFEALGLIDYFGPDGKYYLSYYFKLRLGEGEDPIIPENEVMKTGAWEFFSLMGLPQNLFSANRRVFEEFLRNHSSLTQGFQLKVDARDPN